MSFWDGFFAGVIGGVFVEFLARRFGSERRDIVALKERIARVEGQLDFEPDDGARWTTTEADGDGDEDWANNPDWWKQK